jgi:tripartite-type tricarboxylate transporter receptor subunit TctC
MNSPGTIALATVLCTLIGVAPWRAIAADDYPSRPVTVIVPFTPGGSTDIMARHEAEVLQRALGQRFVVENRPGAGGEIGISYAAKAAPDGYTLLHAPSIIILLPYVMKSVSYDLAKDFAPVMLTGLTQFALVVSPTLPVNSVKDLIALAKSKPGELTYASSGIGTPHQIFAEEFKTMTGTDIRHIPYKGAVPGLTDIASGNVSMEFVDSPPALPLIHAGKLKVLAVLSVKGNSELPGVPPLAETVPGYLLPKRCLVTTPAAGRAFSPAPARRDRSSISSTLRWRRILNGRKPSTALNPLESWRNGTRQASLLLSSPSKARNGSKSFERPASGRSDPAACSLASGLSSRAPLRPPLIQVRT